MVHSMQSVINYGFQNTVMHMYFFLIAYNVYVLCTCNGVFLNLKF